MAGSVDATLLLLLRCESGGARGLRRGAERAALVLYTSMPICFAKAMSAVCEGETKVPPTSTTSSSATSYALDVGK